MDNFEAIFSFLNKNSGSIISIFTVVLVLITLCYTILTRRLVNLNAELVRSEYRPYIKVSFPMIHRGVLVKVENCGRHTARNIKIIADCNPSNIFTEDGRDVFLITKGHEEISFLEPGGSIIDVLVDKRYLGSKDEKPKMVKITVEYYDADTSIKKPFSDVFDINLVQLKYISEFLLLTSSKTLESRIESLEGKTRNDSSYR